MATLSSLKETSGTPINFLMGPESQMLHLVLVDELHASEKINISRARSLKQKIADEDRWTMPILVEKQHYVVMDGHHRLWAARELGLACIPCLMLGYDDPNLELTRWADGQAFPPNRVIEAGLSGELLDFKTTRHALKAAVQNPSFSLGRLRMGAQDG